MCFHGLCVSVTLQQRNHIKLFLAGAVESVSPLFVHFPLPASASTQALERFPLEQPSPSPSPFPSPSNSSPSFAITRTRPSIACLFPFPGLSQTAYTLGNCFSLRLALSCFFVFPHFRDAGVPHFESPVIRSRTVIRLVTFVQPHLARPSRISSASFVHTVANTS